MKEATINGKNLLILELPTDLVEFISVEISHGSVNVKYTDEDVYEVLYGESLPPGQYELLNRGDLISEDTWRGIIPACQYPFKEKYLYLDYVGHKKTGDRQYYDDAKESGLSWLRSLGFDPEKVVLIFKK